LSELKLRPVKKSVARDPWSATRKEQPKIPHANSACGAPKESGWRVADTEEPFCFSVAFSSVVIPSGVREARDLLFVVSMRGSKPKADSSGQTRPRNDKFCGARGQNGCKQLLFTSKLFHIILRQRRKDTVVRARLPPQLACLTLPHVLATMLSFTPHRPPFVPQISVQYSTPSPLSPFPPITYPNCTEKHWGYTPP
jgi:hypothetical protein